MKFSILRAQWPTLFRFRENRSIDGVESPGKVASQGQEDQYNRKVSHLCGRRIKVAEVLRNAVFNFSKNAGPILTSPLGQKAEGFCQKRQVNAEVFSIPPATLEGGRECLLLSALHLPRSIGEESASSAHKEISLPL